jgi:transposase
MRKKDGRSISPEAMTEIRIRAVSRVQEGESPEVVIKSLGFARACIYEWLSKYTAGGWQALETKHAGGRVRKMTAKQIQWLYKTIVRGDPRQYRFSFALWTREIIRQLIKDKFSISLGLSSVTRLLRQLGLSCQKPIFKAWEQDHKAVQNWLKKTFPKIRKLAKKQGATIYFGDEAGVRSDHHSGTTWAKKGETPLVKSTGQRFSVNMISAVSAQGEMRFMVTKERLGSVLFIEFLKRLLIGATRPIYLIVDGHPSHRAIKVKAFVESLKGKLQLFYLPPYSPELNPDELVWSDLKSNLLGRKIVSSRDELKANAVSGLRSIQKNKNKIRSFFNEKNTKYAA